MIRQIFYCKRLSGQNFNDLVIFRTPHPGPLKRVWASFSLFYLYLVFLIFIALARYINLCSAAQIYMSCPFSCQYNCIPYSSLFAYIKILSKTVLIQISWLHQKPADQDSHCFPTSPGIPYHIHPSKPTVCMTFSKAYIKVLLKTVLIQISWLIMKPADQDPHCFPTSPGIHINNEIAPSVRFKEHVSI